MLDVVDLGLVGCVSAVSIAHEWQEAQTVLTALTGSAVEPEVILIVRVPARPSRLK